MRIERGPGGHTHTTTIVLAALVLLLLPQAAAADITNGGFENAGIGPWSVVVKRNPSSGFKTKWIVGPTGSQVLVPDVTSPADLRLAAPDPYYNSNKTVAEHGDTVESLYPYGLSSGTLKLPKYGQYSALVNRGGNYYNVNVMSQLYMTTAADVDPLDGLIHVRFAYAGILQDPGHPVAQQPYFYFRIANTTKNVELYSSFHYANEPGVAWNVGGTTYNRVMYTDWQIFDEKFPDAKLAAGDQILFEAYAAGCAQSGHWGELLVDGIGLGPLPGLSISAAARSATVAPGGTIEYTLTYRNGAEAAIGGIVIDAPIPAGTRYAGYEPPAGGVCTAPPIGATEPSLNCTLPSLASGAAGTMKLSVNVPGNAPLGSQVVYGTYSISGTGAAVVRGAPVTVDVAGLPTTDVGVTISGPASAPLGAEFTYQVQVSNHHAETTAPRVSVGTLLPIPLDLVSATTNKGTCSGSRQIDCAIGDLIAGESATITLTVRTNTPNIASVRTVVTATGQYNDSDLADDTAEMWTEFLILRVTKSVNRTSAYYADGLVYFVTVRNPMSTGATDVVVTDRVPAGTTLSQALDGGTESGGIITWQVGSLPGGATRTLRFAATITATGGTVVNDTYGATATGFGAASGDPVVTSILPNHAPVSQADSVSVNENSTVTFNVLANDSDPDGHTVYLKTVGIVSHGQLSCVPEGGCTYTPAPDYAGPDSFVYSAHDMHGGRSELTTVSITVVPRPTPTVAVTGGTFTYDGTPHSATATVTGINGESLSPVTITYNGGPSAPVGAGTYTVLASFAGNAAYRPASGTATIAILKAQPAITWVTPAPIVYGTALSSVQLNAIASVAGSFAYTPGDQTVLNAGARQLAVLFTPADTANYETATATVTINVSKATPVVTWSNKSIVYQTPLGPGQLDASANVAGSFTYDPLAGTILNAGTHTLSTTFTPADTLNFETVTRTAAITVAKATPVLTWHDSSITYGDVLGGAQLDATSNVAGSFTYDPLAGAILNAGPHTLTASFTPADPLNFETVTRTAALTVAKALPAIIWPDPQPIIYGTPLGASELNAHANVLPPNPEGLMTYTPGFNTVLHAGLHTVTVVVAETANYLGTSDTATVTVTTAPLTIMAAPASKTFGAVNPPFSASGSGFVNGDNLASLQGTLAFTTNATQTTSVGAYDVWPGGVTSPDYAIKFVAGKLTIVPRDTEVAMLPMSAQYSDLATLRATVTPVVKGESVDFGTQKATGAVTFNVNGVALVAGVDTGVATTVYLLNNAPGAMSVNATYASDNPNFNGAVAQTSQLTTLPEDAFATYAGILYASTPSPDTGIAAVTLRATIEDISARGLESPDSPGVITNATVKFVADGTVVADDVPVELISAGNKLVGLATAVWSADIGQQDDAEFTVRTVVQNYYTRDSAADSAIVTVTKPSANAASGGGYIVLTKSSGALAGNAGSRMNFGFNTKYNKNFKNLLGHINVIFRAGGRVFQVKGVPVSLAGVPASGRVSVVWKVNLQDVTVDNAPVPIDGNLSLEVSIVDNGEPGDQDTIAMTLWGKNGELLFSSSWTGTVTEPAVLAGGNLQVH